MGARKAFSLIWLAVPLEFRTFRCEIAVIDNAKIVIAIATSLVRSMNPSSLALIIHSLCPTGNQRHRFRARARVFPKTAQHG